MGKDQAIELGLAIGELILKYGLPAAMDIVSTLKSDQPSLAEIQELKTMVPAPGSYFDQEKKK
ncbi:MAG: hypothetical protein JEZ12_23990 [Desulfobacterium sp.]|nr:hypothetical protein [Desulfobacterium sp.]